MKYLLLPLLLSFINTGCKKPSAEEPVVTEDKELNIKTKIDDGLLVGQLYNTHLPKEIYHLNSRQLKVGYSFTYHKNGALFQISTWINGEKEGKEWTFSSSGQLEGIYQYHLGLLNGNILLYKGGNLKSHQYAKQGKLLYEGFYKGKEKYFNKLYPLFVEEFFFEDKYYAKLKFPIDYLGQLLVKVKNSGSPLIDQLEDNIFQIVINDALDLNAYELDITYHPAQQDTMVNSTYSFEHTIYSID